MDPQTLADQLAHELARSVAVATIGREIVGISYAAADHPTLFNAARPALPEMLHEWAGSGSTGLSADPDGWTEHPLSAHGIRSGFVLLADSGRALQSHEHTLLELAATVLAAAHGITGEQADIREVGFRLLLSYDPAERRAALHRARARRWVTAAGPIAVHALLFDDQSGTLSRQLSLQRICRRLPANVDVLRERGNVVFLLSRSTHDDIDVDTLVRTAATEAGLPLVGVGSATVHAEDEDLARAAHAAETAAEINVAVPELAGNTRADRLGGWHCSMQFLPNATSSPSHHPPRLRSAPQERDTAKPSRRTSITPAKFGRPATGSTSTAPRCTTASTISPRSSRTPSPMGCNAAPSTSR